MTKNSKFHSWQEQQNIIYPEESTSALEPAHSYEMDKSYSITALYSPLGL